MGPISTPSSRPNSPAPPDVSQPNPQHGLTDAASARPFLARLLPRLRRAPRDLRDWLIQLPLPQGGLYVVGDIHGRRDLYDRVESWIRAEAAQGAVIVILGDLVDRGADTAGLIDHFLTPCPDGISRVILRGNHEAAMADFLDHPDRAPNWLEIGGAETLASYGLRPADWADCPEGRRGDLLAAHIPQSHRDFLRALPLAAQCGAIFLSHAGLNCAKPLADQDAADLLWSRIPPDAAALPKGIGAVIHGHMPQSRADAPAGMRPPVINLDTAAYATGRLSCLALDVQGRARLAQTCPESGAIKIFPLPELALT